MTAERGEVWLANLEPTRGSEQAGSIATTLAYFNRALAIAIELGIPLVEECETLRRKLEQEYNDSDH